MLNYRPLPESSSLDERKTVINEWLRRAKEHEGKDERYRWQAGVELLAAKKLVPYGQWESWCHQNIARSQQDIRKIMAMAGSDDPVQAHEDEKAETRERVALHRTRAQVPCTRDLSQEVEHPSREVDRPSREVDRAEKLFQSWLALEPEDRERARDLINDWQLEQTPNVVNFRKGRKNVA